jgi:hypothetical protein
MFMSNTAEMTERHGKVLADLAEIGMCIAREVQGQVLAAETPEEKARAAAAFPPVARAVRQTVALEAKLRRDQARQDREDQDEANRQIAGAIRRRKAQVRMHMQRAICNAFPDALDEDDDGDGPPDEILLRFEDLRDRLDDEILDADFALRPFHEVIQGLHRSLKLPPPEDLAEEAEADQEAEDPEPEPPPPDPAMTEPWRPAGLGPAPPSG